MTRRMRDALLVCSLLLMIGIVAVACGPAAGSLDPISQTLTPLNAEVKATITVRAANSNGNNSLSTAIAKATSEADLVYSTQTADASLDSPARLATATAIAPVIAELSFFGIDPSQGYVAWLHPPVTITLQGFHQTGYANNFQNITAGDFVMAADVTWHTLDSASGCGFMFRSNGDTNKPSQYVVIITRTASGHMAFLGMADGKIANFRSFYPKGNDKSFNWFNDSTNRVAVVARGKLIDLYTNDVLIGEVDVTQPPSSPVASLASPELPAGATPAQLQDYTNQVNQMGAGLDQINGELSQARQNFATGGAPLTDGFLGFVGLSESGTTTCDFKNGWLFQLVK
jgi:hypothetical protein